MLPLQEQKENQFTHRNVKYPIQSITRQTLTYVCVFVCEAFHAWADISHPTANQNSSLESTPIRAQGLYCVCAIWWAKGVCVCVCPFSSTRLRTALPTNSLHSSVSERPAHINRLHGRKHNLFDATLPTCLKSYRQTPALLTFWLWSHIPYRRAGKRTPYTHKSLFKVKASLRLLWNYVQISRTKSHFMYTACKFIICAFVNLNMDC